MFCFISLMEYESHGYKTATLSAAVSRVVRRYHRSPELVECVSLTYLLVTYHPKQRKTLRFETRPLVSSRIRDYILFPQLDNLVLCVAVRSDSHPGSRAMTGDTCSTTFSSMNSRRLAFSISPNSTASFELKTREWPRANSETSLLEDIRVFDVHRPQQNYRRGSSMNDTH